MKSYIQGHSRAVVHLGLLFLIMALLGCGESTKDAMIRIAKQRAAAKEKAAKEAENAPKEGGDATAQPNLSPHLPTRLKLRTRLRTQRLPQRTNPNKLRNPCP